jgi:hypothetical protein
MGTAPPSPLHDGRVLWLAAGLGFFFFARGLQSVVQALSFRYWPRESGPING